MLVRRLDDCARAALQPLWDAEGFAAALGLAAPSVSGLQMPYCLATSSDTHLGHGAAVGAVLRWGWRSWGEIGVAAKDGAPPSVAAVCGKALHSLPLPREELRQRQQLSTVCACSSFTTGVGVAPSSRVWSTAFTLGKQRTDLGMVCALCRSCCCRHKRR